MKKQKILQSFSQDKPHFIFPLPLRIFRPFVLFPENGKEEAKNTRECFANNGAVVPHTT